MSSSAADFDRERLRALASAVMDGTADEALRHELTTMLRESAAARDEYLALADLHAILVTELSAEPSSEVAVHTRSASSTPSVQTRPPNRTVYVTAAAALAACLLIAVALFGRRESEVAAESFVAVAQVTDAVWSSSQVAVGDRFGATTLRLESGFVRLEYDSGVEVTLEGPAEFDMFDVVRAELKSGLLTATVPPGAEGFTVKTPTAEVVDLGTSFGIDLREDGFSNVSVFDGEVEVAVRDRAQTRLLVEGESVRVGSDYEIKDVGFDPQPFEKLWPIASGIVGSTKTIRFVPPWPRRIRFVESDDDIFVAAEGRSVELVSELEVNISEPGDYANEADLTPVVFQPGERVRSYILHYSPKTQLGPRRATRVTGSITFDRPVLGVIVDHDELIASSRRFSRRGAGEGNVRRELNLTGEIAGDRVTLSEDCRTVTLELVSPGRTSDLLRVIVDGNGRFRTPMRRKRN